MAALPGQRAAQRPMRAAVAAQRALGRAAATAGGIAGRMVLEIASRRWVVTHQKDGQQIWTDHATQAHHLGGPNGERLGGT